MYEIHKNLRELVHGIIKNNDPTTKEIPINEILNLKFSDVNIDSLEIMEMIIEIEDKFSIEVDDKMLIDREDSSIGEILSDISQLLS